MIVRYTVDIEIDTSVAPKHPPITTLAPDILAALSATLSHAPPGTNAGVEDALRFGIMIGIRNTFRSGYLPEFVTVVDFQDVLIDDESTALVDILNRREPVQDGAKHEPAKRPQNE